MIYLASTAHAVSEGAASFLFASKTGNVYPRFTVAICLPLLPAEDEFSGGGLFRLFAVSGLLFAAGLWFVGRD